MPAIQNGGGQDDDPRPIPPECPDSSECCNSGCSPCIFDLYAEELNRYRAALQAWETRHKAAAR
ncbi:MAG: oxidoreductase-like domain-containing protein [Noviherbaspirillum sp.]